MSAVGGERRATGGSAGPGVGTTIINKRILTLLAEKGEDHYFSGDNEDLSTPERVGGGQALWPTLAAACMLGMSGQAGAAVFAAQHHCSCPKPSSLPPSLLPAPHRLLCSCW